MSEKDKNVFGGFEAMSDFISKPGGDVGGDELPIVDPEDIIEDDIDEKDTDSDKGDEEREPSIKDDKSVEEIDEGDADADGDESETKEEGAEDILEVDEELESEITKIFQDKLSEELGWEFGEDEQFKTPKEMIEYLTDMVQEASKPDFANDEIRKLDEFVKNGGDLKKFYEVSDTGGLDLDSIELDENEVNQKAVLSEYLRNVRNYSNDRANKAINRWDEGGTLAEEAEDALELLKEYKTEKSETLLKEQEKQAKEFQLEQQKYISNVQDSIKSLNNIRGINISSKEKQDLLDYIFKPGRDGATQYQKDYQSNVKNLIESAYFTKMGDKLLDKVKKSASTNAYKNVHEKLKASKGKRQKTSGGQLQDDKKQSNTLEQLGTLIN
jgi:hypothetical protein